MESSAHNGAPLSGRVAFVTGAASGIGRATSIALSAAGAIVVAADRDAHGAAVTAGLIRDARGEAVPVEIDVTGEASVSAAVAETLKLFGRLDVAVNCAGIRGNPEPLHTTTLTDWDHVLSVNLLGVFLCMKHELVPMLDSGGAIVNISSVAGIGPAASAAYGASKHGVIGLTRTAAKQYAPRGIRVNAICPGSVDTPMTAAIPAENRLVGPIGRTGQPNEVGEVAAWLCTDAASYVVGQIISVDGGWANR